MDLNDHEPRYCINTCSWEKSTINGRKKIIKLLKSTPETAKDICELFFDKYDIIHQVGHIIRSVFVNETDIANKKVEEEYYANLFAIKYFQYKNEIKYVRCIEKCISSLLRIYNVSFEFDLKRLNRLFSRYESNTITFAALHFKSIQKCLEETGDLEAVLGIISNNKLDRVNKSIITRAGITGQDLLNECIHIVFGHSPLIPDIDIKYVDYVDILKMEKLETSAHADN